MRKSLFVAAILATINAVSFSHAADLRAAQGLGTPGFGLEVTRSFSQSIAGKLSINRFNFDRNGMPNDRDYPAQRHPSSLSASLNWHPFQSGFRLSGGMLYTLAGVGSSSGPNHDDVAAEDGAYFRAGLDELAATFTLRNFVPYLGIGWDNVLTTNKGVRFRFDLGITFAASADALFNTRGAIEQAPLGSQDITGQEQSIDEEVDAHEYSPVFSIGSSYAF